MLNEQCEAARVSLNLFAPCITHVTNVTAFARACARICRVSGVHLLTSENIAAGTRMDQRSVDVK